MSNDALSRWHASEGRSRQLVCVGDSITRSFDGGPPGLPGRSWVELLAIALSRDGKLCPGEGFRGLWRGDEWSRAGTWTRTEPSDGFDVAPFGWALSSSGLPTDELTWTKPEGTTVAAFDLYSVNAPDVGSWQYRIDDAPWRTADKLARSTENRLRRVFVNAPVQRRVQIRGSNGVDPCVTAVAGIDPYAIAPVAAGTRVHNLGVGMEFLSHFCRSSAGDPLSLLDALRPELVLVAFSNDVLFTAPSRFEESLRQLVERVAPFGDTLLISAYEQRPPRLVHDATTSAGSRTVISEDARFLPSDARERVLGPGLSDEPPTVITSVESSRRITVSRPATEALQSAELVIGIGRETSEQAQYRATTKSVSESMGCVHVDLYDEWSSSGAAGWDAAYATGLMLDRYHASQLGHRDIAARLLGVLGTTETRR